VDKETKERLTNEVKDLRKAIEEKNTENVKTLMDKLSKDIQEVGAKMYQQASANTQQSAQSNSQNSGSSDGKTVDAEYKEKS